MSKLVLDLPPSVDEQLRELAEREGVSPEDAALRLKDGLQAALADALLELTDALQEPGAGSELAPYAFALLVAAWLLGKRTSKANELPPLERVRRLHAFAEKHEQRNVLADYALHRSHIYEGRA